MGKRFQTLISDLAFGESPRWHDGRLYLADMHAHRIAALRPDGGLETIAQFDAPVGGIGWLPNGRMLVVSMHERRVLRQQADGGFIDHADLSAIATWHANDMVVAPNGEAYVGNFGFSLDPPIDPASVKLAKLARISPDGTAEAVGEDLFFPNGMVITPDGATLIVAESASRQLTAFRRNADGTLTDRRLWASLPPDVTPDGVCLDAEGAIWVAGLSANAVVRIGEGGRELDRIVTEQQAVACVLGGDDRRTLFVCTADTTDPATCRASPTARLLSARVDVPGAGCP
jgi:sugar lactone lactonase YvrE